MKPYSIYLIRHGESEGNANWELYKTVPDWKLHLTDTGKQQAELAACQLRAQGITLEQPIQIYASPWYRTRETAQIIRKYYKNSQYREDPRLREQEWGNYQKEELHSKIGKERDGFGTFFYRMPYGESGADVYDRVTTFIDTMHRDFQKETFPGNVIIISHGLTIRAFLMRWFHWTVEEYESLANPENCDIIKMKLIQNTQKYVLDSDLRKKPNTWVDTSATS